MVAESSKERRLSRRGPEAEAEREARLAKALRQNLKRRKTQARSRDAEAKSPAGEAVKSAGEEAG